LESRAADREIDEKGEGVGDARALTRRVPRGVRIVGWILLILGGWGLLDLLIGTAESKAHPSLVVGVPSAVINMGLGWALLRGFRWAYAPVLLTLVAAEGLAAWIFFVKLADRYSLAVRLQSGLLVMILAAVPVVLMLTPSARRWARNESATVGSGESS
jgi:hypothetical protein